MDLMFLVGFLLGIAWYAAGWLPTRLIKHYFNTTFASGRGFSNRDEGLAVWTGLLGPAWGIGLLLAWLDVTRDYPKGWQW